MDEKRFYLVYDSEELNHVSSVDEENINDFFHQKYKFESDFKTSIPEESFVILLLSDEQNKEFIEKTKDKKLKIGFLPHQHNFETRNGFQISENIADCISDFKENDKVINSDLLYCNEKVVFNYLIIGSLVTTFTKKRTQNRLVSFIKQLWGLLKNYNKTKPKKVEITADEKDSFTTAVAEILITQHGKNSVISRLILENSYLNDGLFHALLFAPRSFSEVIFSFIKSKFSLRQFKGIKAFNFLGHLKTNQLKFKFEQSTNYSIDGKVFESDQLFIEIQENFKLIPSKNLLFTKEEKNDKKIYRVENLPKGEAMTEMIGKRLPLIKHASTEEYKELFTTLRDNAKTKSSYLILMILSTLLATFGLFADSTPVIIGAMILAPLISPVISLSMGVLRQEKKIMQDSLVTIGSGILFSYIAAIILTLITPLYAINSEIGSRLEPNLLDLGVAVISGIAGAYAHANTAIAKTLAGVAIAVALVPPLAVSAIGLGWGEWKVFFGAFLLLITNLTGMVLAGSFTFLLMGYSPFKIAKKGLLISLAIVLSISVPLGYGFFQVVRENKIVNSVNRMEVKDMRIKQVEVINKNPLKLAIKVVADHNPGDEEIRLIKEKIEDKLGREVRFEMTFSLEVD